MIVRWRLDALPGVLDELSVRDAIAERAPAKANPRPAPTQAIHELLEEIW
jgi:hypothetical protein